MTGVQILTVAEGEGDTRLDRWLKKKFPQLSQGAVEKMCRTGQLRVDGGRAKASDRLADGAQVRVPPLPETPALRTEPVPGIPDEDARMIQEAVLWKDEHIIALNKPPGLPSQGGSGQGNRHVDGLLDALRFGYKDRPKLVHRLDKDTSGVMVVAKTALAHEALSAAFAARDLDRAYLALVWGLPAPAAGSIAGAIGRDPRERKRMAVVSRGGKSALTHYRTLAGHGTATALLECRLATGRTHQIRVHLAAHGHPVVGDPLYLRRIPAAARTLPDPLRRRLLDFPRQALHASRLGFAHPRTGQPVSFSTAPPPDMQALLDALGMAQT